MTKKTNLKWRLGKLPSVDEVLTLMDRKIITKDEATKILFNSEIEEDRDKKSLESEIKFLRELVEKLSKGRAEIIETIRYIEKPYYQYPWWNGYSVWCGGATLTTGTTNGSTYLCSSGGDTTLTGGLISGQTSATLNSTGDFSSIKTF